LALSDGLREKYKVRRIFLKKTAEQQNAEPQKVKLTLSDGLRENISFKRIFLSNRGTDKQKNVEPQKFKLS
jgi:hypothetical protein